MIGYSGGQQKEKAAAAEAAGLLRAIRHRVSIADMAAGLSAATGGELSMASLSVPGVNSPEAD